jgi:glycosyltransferase involved in cell wall biosynthesis
LSIKSYFPNWFKYPFWWLFKSPQRKIHPSSLYSDLKGLAIFLRYQFFSPGHLQPISICTGVYNRSEALLKHLLPSIEDANNKSLIEFSVADCDSNDVLNLENTIKNSTSFDIVYNKYSQAFSRSFAFNMAVKQCSHPLVFICDADMSIPKNIVALCNAYAAKKRAWYPIVFYLEKDKPAKETADNGHWMQYGGKGMLACTRKDFMEIGMLNENYTTWGKEDDELWERFVKANFVIIRYRQRGLIHHWHPSFNPKYQKKDKTFS